MEKPIRLTPQLRSFLTQEIAEYRKRHPKEEASDRFLEALAIEWMLVSNKLSTKELRRVDVVGLAPAVFALPTNLCDDSLELSDLNCAGFLDEILEFAGEAHKEEYPCQHSDELRIALTLAIKLRNGEAERYHVAGVPWFKTTQAYEDEVAAFAAEKGLFF